MLIEAYCCYSSVVPLNWTVGMPGILAATVEDALIASVFSFSRNLKIQLVEIIACIQLTMSSVHPPIYPPSIPTQTSIALLNELQPSLHLKRKKNILFWIVEWKVWDGKGKEVTQQWTGRLDELDADNDFYFAHRYNNLNKRGFSYCSYAAICGHPPLSRPTYLQVLCSYSTWYI